jgi:hypothetical protein
MDGLSWNGRQDVAYNLYPLCSRQNWDILIYSLDRMNGIRPVCCSLCACNSFSATWRRANTPIPEQEGRLGLCCLTSP